MARQVLSLATLKEFDYGKAEVTFQRELEKVVRDCLDRPAVGSAREVRLVALIKPLILQEGDVVDAEVSWRIASKTPAYETPGRPVAVTKKGQLFFNDLAPDNPRQSTLDELG